MANDKLKIGVGSMLLQQFAQVKFMHASSAKIHPSAAVSDQARIGPKTLIWNQCQVREDAIIGQNCILGKDVYVDFGVQIGDNVKIQNGSYIYHGTTLEGGVFVGPGVIFTNDKKPRAINPDGSLKGDDNWEVGETRVLYGASVGAGAIILPGLIIGRFALIGAGAVVTRDVPDHALVIGNPARQVGFVCKCATKLVMAGETGAYNCPICGERYQF
jgi:UDP-2-acetamido-3-amino-2,3-dideoxy-glucuronate N-acetyltransferase